MFKNIVTAMVMVVAFVQPAIAELGSTAPWGSVEEEMQYNDQRSPWRPGNLPKDLSPAAVLQANKMWCKEIQQNTERAVYKRMGALWANTVEQNPRGFYFHHDVHNLDMMIRNWYTAQVDGMWRRLLNNPKLDYRQCLEAGAWQVQKVEGAIAIFKKDYEKPFQR